MTGPMERNPRFPATHQPALAHSPPAARACVILDHQPQASCSLTTDAQVRPGSVHGSSAGPRQRPHEWRLRSSNHWLLFEAAEFWGILLPSNKCLIDMHLFLGGEILTLSRFGGRGGGRHLVFSKRIPTIGQKKFPEKGSGWIIGVHFNEF